MSTPNLTLYGIETQLLELLTFREEIENDREMPEADRAESLKAIENQIAEYVKREVSKVDGIAAMLREFEKRADTLEHEAERIRDISVRWRRRYDSLKDMAKSIMISMHKPRLEGLVSTLALRKSPASVAIHQPDLLPATFQRVSVTMTLDLWQRVKDQIIQKQMSALWFELTECGVSEPQPIKPLIKEELKAKRGVPGAYLVEDNQYLKVD